MDTRALGLVLTITCVSVDSRLPLWLYVRCETLQGAGLWLYVRTGKTKHMSAHAWTACMCPAYAYLELALGLEADGDLGGLGHLDRDLLVLSEGREEGARREGGDLVAELEAEVLVLLEDLRVQGARQHVLAINVLAVLVLHVAKGPQPQHLVAQGHRLRLV